MPAEILVMCPSCSLPQAARNTCTRCGAALPESPLGPAAQAAPAPAPEPEAVIPLAGGRSIRFGDDALEVRQDGAAQRLAFTSIRRVTFHRSWSAPALAVLAAGLFSAAVVSSWPLRLLGLVVAGAGAWMLARGSAWVMRVERQGEQPIRVPLGSGGLRSAGASARTAWLTAADELRRRGVEVTE